ncbi:myeloid leukemia factor 1 isoform X2 [Globicephala melas]|uniref:myeloid leukemia factor 1 isoform X2 n=1 Tax=Globicephala melas TaxID=9731 RepID=UPI00293D92F0|nr:myeloid leukemia factor 1 isoform X2 [Globicephala melas]
MGPAFNGKAAPRQAPPFPTGTALATGRQASTSAGPAGSGRGRGVTSFSNLSANAAARDRARMFGMLSSSFEDDPFFSDSFMAHQESMRQMMRNFSEPFGRDLFSISDGRGRARNHTGHEDGENSLTDIQKEEGKIGRLVYARAVPQPRIHHSAMDRMMLNMRNSMQELQRNFGNLSTDPNGHSFSSSSVMTYSKVGDEPPKVFQASTQTRRAPGGVKETRRALRDSESGLEKMAVGHHLHDRAHVIKKSKNKKTGDEEVNQEFINMNESDAHAFDDEWQNEVLKYQPRGQWHNLENSRMRNIGHENSGSRELKRREKLHQSPAIERGRRSNVYVDKLNIKGSPMKINKK